MHQRISRYQTPPTTWHMRAIPTFGQGLAPDLSGKQQRVSGFGHLEGAAEVCKGMGRRTRTRTRPIALPDLIHETRRDERGDNNEMSTLTDPPPEPEDRRTRVWLRMISQEPFRIEFHRIGVGSRVVHYLPVCQGRKGIKKTLRQVCSSFPPALHSPDVREYHGSLGNEIPLVLVVLGNNVWESWWVSRVSLSRNGGESQPVASNNGGLTKWCHWVPPEHLFHQRFGVRKIRHINQHWEPIVPNDPIDLRLGFTLNFWVHHHRQVE